VRGGGPLLDPRSRPLGRRSLCWPIALALSACGGGLPKVPTGPHQDVAPPILVESPPPPALVEPIPERPEAGCLWRDGTWEWDAAGYVWRPGAWVEAPEGCYFAPPVGTWIAGARRAYGFRPARWYPGDRIGACPAPRTCGARPVVE
jgi:hypothetical protein